MEIHITDIGGCIYSLSIPGFWRFYYWYNINWCPNWCPIGLQIVS